MLTQLSRRAFLLGLGAAMIGLQGTGFAAESGDHGLEQFRDLSAVLTGFEPRDLNLELARTYRDALLQTEPTSLALLLQSAGQPPSLEGLQSSGAFEDPHLHRLANRVIELWFTGIYPTGRGSQVASFRYNLLWKTLDFAHPPTYCGPPWWK